MILNKIIQMVHKYKAHGLEFNGEPIPLKIGKDMIEVIGHVNGTICLDDSDGKFGKIRYEYYIENDNFIANIISSNICVYNFDITEYSKHIISHNIEIDEVTNNIKSIVLKSKDYEIYDEYNFTYNDDGNIVKINDIVFNYLEGNIVTMTLDGDVNEKIYDLLVLNKDNCVKRFENSAIIKNLQYGDKLKTVTECHKIHDEDINTTNEYIIEEYTDNGDLIYFENFNIDNDIPNTLIKFEIQYNEDEKIKDIQVYKNGNFEGRYEFIY